MTKKLIGYVRVSSDEQGKSGNGILAQRAAIAKFADDAGYEVLEVVEEWASGKLNLDERPLLAAAIAKAKKLGAYVVVSKLDRLSRQVEFVANLMNTQVKFIVVALGEQVDNLMLHIYAAFAEQERKVIGLRTKEALAQLKAKGVKLGQPNVEDYVDSEGVQRLGMNSARSLATTKVGATADAFASRMEPSIKRMLASGMSMRAIAVEFNGNGTKTARGGMWSASTVSNIVARLG